MIKKVEISSSVRDKMGQEKRKGGLKRDQQTIRRAGEIIQCKNSNDEGKEGMMESQNTKCMQELFSWSR